MYKLLLAFVIFSCTNKTEPDFEKEKKEILELEAKQREFHFKKNAKEFTEMFSNDYLAINRGIIEKPSRQSSFEMFDRYFNSVEFVKWDDKSEPVIQFSDDASIAYVAVDKQVILKLPGKNGAPVMDSTDYAWLTVYKKIGNQWQIDCVVSTNK